MKKRIKYIISALAGLLLFATVSFAQETSKEITFIFQNESIIKDSLGQKVFEFYISGLNSQQEAELFVSKFKAVKGVENIIISQQLTDNKRFATASFLRMTTKNGLKNALIKSGVNKVIINGSLFNTSDI